MGFLRDDEDRTYIRGITEEVTHLFGTDAILYKFSAADNVTTRDPIYDEPSQDNAVKYHAFPIQCMFFQYNDTPFATKEGLYSETTAQGHITYDHLIAAGVIPDPLTRELLSEGDVLEIHPDPRFGRVLYDIIQTTKDGWINDTGYYTGYTFSLKRSTKYIPERKELDK